MMDDRNENADEPAQDSDRETPSHQNESSESASSDDKPDRADDKRGEGPGNLKRRSDWFQKRHGGG